MFSFARGPSRLQATIKAAMADIAVCRQVELIALVRLAYETVGDEPPLKQSTWRCARRFVERHELVVFSKLGPQSDRKFGPQRLVWVVDPGSAVAKLVDQAAAGGRLFADAVFEARRRCVLVDQYALTDEVMAAADAGENPLALRLWNEREAGADDDEMAVWQKLVEADVQKRLVLRTIDGALSLATA